MGQLEKYGLYVMCLVIFLIFGVAIWGEPAVAASLEPSTASQARAAVQPQNRSESTRDNGLLELTTLMMPVQEPPKSQPTRRQRPAVVPDPVVDEPELDEPVVVPTPQPVERKSYTVVKGDTLGEIASKQIGSTRYLPLLLQLNPGLRPERLKVGKRLTLPTAAEVADFAKPAGGSAASQAAIEAGPATADIAELRKYEIQRGDTLDGLARRFLGGSARTGDILKLNPGIDPARMRIGQVVVLPVR